MKLLAHKEATISLKKSNEELLKSNFRLRDIEKNILNRLNTAKENYDPEKVKALKDYEQFIADITEKKSKLLKELKAYEKLIEERKDIYYGLIERQDELDEREYQIKESHNKLDLREAMIVDLEAKLRNKQI